MRKKFLSLLLAFALLVSLLPTFALADDAPPFAVAIADCTQVAVDETMDDAPVYRCDTAAPAGTAQIAFTDFADSMEEFGAISSCGTSYAMEDCTHIAPLTGYLFESGCDADWTRLPGHESDSFEGLYAYFVMTDDMEFYYFLVSVTPSAPPAPTGDPFTVSGGEIVSCEENAYTYKGWGKGDAVGSIYTVAVPFGTEEVTLDFAVNSVAYNYNVRPENRPIVIDDTGMEVNWLAGSYPYDGVGVSSATVKTDYNADGVFDFIQVQTPYNADWSGGDFLYAVTFRYTIEASADGNALTVAPSTAYYKDFYADRVLPVYTVTVPAGAAQVALDFSDSVLAYNYKADGKTWLAGYYADKYDPAYAAAPASAPLYTGVHTLTVPVDADGDGTPDFVQVQSPYIYNADGWDYGSESRYALTFAYADGEGASAENPAPASYAALLSGIAAAGAYDTDAWLMLSEKAYDGADHTPYAGYTGSAAPAALATAANSADSAAVTAALAALDSFDPAAPYAEYTAPYVLMAYAAAGAPLDTARENALLGCIVTALGDTQNPFYSADTVGMLLPALVPYCAANADIRAAVEDGIAWLSAHQDANGSWGNTDSDAVVITALAACGIDAHTDKRFVKANGSAVEALLSRGFYDGSGFGYDDNTVYNALATEQGFRALVAYARFRANGAPYNIYTDARLAQDTVSAPDLTAKPTHSGGAGGSSKKLTVSFTLLGGKTTWLTDTVEVRSGETVYDLLVRELAENGYTYEGSSSYIAAITAPDGTRLGEFSTGSASGWLYRVNDTVPKTAIGSYALTKDCAVTVYYTDDWTRDPYAGGAVADTPAPAPAPEEKPLFSDIAESDWYYAAAVRCAERGLISGTETGEFAPNMPLDRAMLTTILWRAAGEPTVDGIVPFADVAPESWYEEAVRWAYSERIVSGFDEATFAPAAPITREQLALMLCRYTRRNAVAYAVGDLNGFSDAAQVSPWAGDAVRWAVGMKLLTGSDTGALMPCAGATRAETAVMLCRWLDLPAQTCPAPEATVSYLLSAVPAPAVASIGGEWAVIGAVCSGCPVPESWKNSYLAAAEDYIRVRGGVLSERKYTEYSRVILALTLLGVDARDAFGYDLTVPLTDCEKTMQQGLNGAVWALLALDCAAYPTPDAVRETYRTAILTAQHADGGWGLAGDASEADITAMAVRALAPYRTESAVSAAIDRAVSFLAEQQKSDGGYASSGSDTAESCAQVLLALTALTVDVRDARFVKNGNTVADALLTYMLPDGSFCHTRGEAANLMATEQALLALGALYHAQNG